MSQNEIVKSGYLTKSPPVDAPSISQWRRRWFVLRDSIRSYPLAERYVRLEYYQNESEARKLSDPKGIVNLTECYRVSGSAAVKGHKYVFDVCTPDRKYHLAADTPSEKHEWILTLNEVLFSTSIVPPQVKTQDLEDAEFQIQRRKSQSKAALKQISLENVSVDVTQRPQSCYDHSSGSRMKRPLPPTPDQEFTSLPGTISVTNRAPGSPVPKPRTKKPGDVSRSPIPPSQPNGSIYSAIGGGEGGRGDSVQSVVPSASDYEVPVQSIRQLNHGRNSASSLKEEEVPPPPPPRRKGGSQGTPDQAIVTVSEQFNSAQDRGSEMYETIDYPHENNQREEDDEEEEGAYGHLIRIGAIQEPSGVNPSHIPLSVHSSLPCSFSPNYPLPQTHSQDAEMKSKRPYYENTGFAPIREETYTRLSHFN